MVCSTQLPRSHSLLRGAEAHYMGDSWSAREQTVFASSHVSVPADRRASEATKYVFVRPRARAARARSQEEVLADLGLVARGRAAKLVCADAKPLVDALVDGVVLVADLRGRRFSGKKERERGTLGGDADVWGMAQEGVQAP